MYVTWKNILLIWFLAICNLTLAQNQNVPDSLVSGNLKGRATIRNIQIAGNRITKRYIILRELPLKEGMSYSVQQIFDGIGTARQNLLNTLLFVDSDVTFGNWVNDSLDIKVNLKERWYYIPFPYFKPIDRSWNVWIHDHHMNIDRVNYGLKFMGKNITGRNDKLNVWLIGGYTKRVALNYYNPYTDNKLLHGFGFDFSNSKNHEMNYATGENKQLFFKDPNHFVRTQTTGGITYSYRKGSIKRHYLRLGFQSDKIADTIVKLNSSYLPDAQTHLVYPELKYAYQYFNYDYNIYPTKGNSFEFEFLKRGMDKRMNLWQFIIKGGSYYHVGTKNYFGTTAEMHLRLPFDQPYMNQFFLGYNEAYLRGMEYYVMDGVAGGVVRNTFGRKIASIRQPTGLKSAKYESIPFNFYLKAFVDAGYAYNKHPLASNSLVNRPLYSGGFGLDVTSIYDVVVKLEFSFNFLGERGLYIHKADPK